MDDLTKHIEKLVIQLQSPNKNKRYEACEFLRVAPTITPEAIMALQNILKDPAPDVAEAAQRALSVHSPPEDPDKNQSPFVQSQEAQNPNQPIMQPTDEKSHDSEKNVYDLLQKQNKILENIQILLYRSAEKSDKEYQIRSRIVDMDMSIGSMIVLSFKWLIASIPIGIVFGILIILFRGCS